MFADVSDIPLLKNNASARKRDQLQEKASERAFSAAGFTHKTEHLTFSDVEGDAIHGAHLLARGTQPSASQRKTFLKLFDFE
jgi:hypothetical protein